MNRSKSDLIISALYTLVRFNLLSEKTLPALLPFPRPLTLHRRICLRNNRWRYSGQTIWQADLTNKLIGRQFAIDHGVKVPNLYLVCERMEEPPEFDALPPKFVLKPTIGHSSQNVFAIEHGVNFFDGELWDRSKVIEFIRAQPDLTENPSVRYIVEEYLEDWDFAVGLPLDYKFYMFGSRLVLIRVLERGNDRKIKRAWQFDPKWAPISIPIVIGQSIPTESLPKPDCFDDMIRDAHNLGKALGIFMRVDLYATTGGSVFGEFTPSPGSGFTRWGDNWLGGMWRGLEGAGDRLGDSECDESRRV